MICPHLNKECVYDEYADACHSYCKYITPEEIKRQKSMKEFPEYYKPIRLKVKGHDSWIAGYLEPMFDTEDHDWFTDGSNLYTFDDVECWENCTYDMDFAEAQDYISKRGFDIPWNDGEVSIDVNHITQSIANALKWADEHPVK